MVPFFIAEKGDREPSPVSSCLLMRSATTLEADASRVLNFINKILSKTLNSQARNDDIVEPDPALLSMAVSETQPSCVTMGQAVRRA